MDMYRCVVIYSQNVCPPVKLWQESVKIEKNLWCSGAASRKKSGEQGVWSLSWVSTIWKGSDPLLLMWWCSGSSTLAVLESEGQVGELQQPGLCSSSESIIELSDGLKTRWTCEGFNLLLMEARVLWRCSSPGGRPGSSSPLVSLLQLFIFIKRVECPQHFAQNGNKHFSTMQKTFFW